MLELMQGDVNRGKGLWSVAVTGYVKPGVLVSCPKCGCVALLDHEVAADGTVKPSVVCPKEGCGFHDSVRLIGWQP